MALWRLYESVDIAGVCIIREFMHHLAFKTFLSYCSCFLSVIVDASFWLLLIFFSGYCWCFISVIVDVSFLLVLMYCFCNYWCILFFLSNIPLLHRHLLEYNIIYWHLLVVINYGKMILPNMIKYFNILPWPNFLIHTVRNEMVF